MIPPNTTRVKGALFCKMVNISDIAILPMLVALLLIGLFGVQKKQYFILTI